MRVGFIGECMSELREAENGLLSQGFAGDTYNSAVYMKRTFPQHDVYYISAVGKDALSDEMVMHAVNEGINPRFIGRHEEKHLGLYRIYTDDTGERSFVYWRSDSAAKSMMQTLDSNDIAAMTAFDMVLFSGISLAIINEEDLSTYFSLLTRLKSAGVKLVFDINHRPSLWKSKDDAKRLYAKAYELADIILPGIEDFNFLYGIDTIDETLKFLSDYTFDEVIIKNGSDAVTVINQQGDISQVPLTPVENVVDTTSAGDAFNGVYLGARLEDSSQKEAVDKASKSAGFVIQHKGAIVDSTAYSLFSKNLT